MQQSLLLNPWILSASISRCLSRAGLLLVFSLFDQDLLKSPRLLPQQANQAKGHRHQHQGKGKSGQERSTLQSSIPT